MTDNSELNKLSTEELEEIVHTGDNLHIPTSRASRAKRILETRRHKELMASSTKNKNDLDMDGPESELLIFYSWQSDLPNKTNRGLIESALKLAVKNISKDNSIEIIPRVDMDTSDVPGSPNIAATILSKIDQSFLVVADVSIINNKTRSRPTPNPNVIYELGYAVKGLGLQNVVMVQNEAYGPPEKLPFDLKMQRVIRYRCLENDSKSEVRTKLSAQFEQAVRLALEQRTKKKVNSTRVFKKLLSVNSSPILLESKLKAETDKVLGKLNGSELYIYNTQFSKEVFLERKSLVEKVMKEHVNTYVDLGQWANETHLKIISRQFERIAIPPVPENSYNEVLANLAWYPGLLILYALGLGACYNENSVVLKSVLDIRFYNRFSGNEEPITNKTSVFEIFRYYKDIVKDELRYFPVSDHLFGFFRNNFQDISDEKYEDLFDTFEFVLSLSYGRWDINQDRSRFWIPMGSYAWRTRRRKIWNVIASNVETRKDYWLSEALNLKGEGMKEVIKNTLTFLAENTKHFW